MRSAGRLSVLLACLCGVSLVALVLGVVTPVRFESASPSAAMQLIRTGLTAVLVLTVLIGPGIMLRAWRPRWMPSLTYVPLPGLATLIVAGLVTWALARNVSPKLVSDAFLAAALLVIATPALARARHVDGALSRPERRTLAVAGLLLAVVAAKALWSVAPVGELYGGTVSRTLEVGDRSDSRISYHVVQLVAHGENPYSAVGAANFLPFTFVDRGPLAGIAAAPITLSTGAALPVGKPDQPWVPFDAQGLAAYGIAMEAMAVTVLLSVFGILVAITKRELARELGVVIAATTPFIVHETYFTWPKLLTVALVLAAAQMLLAWRPVRSGLLLGVAYLVHPLALLSAPTLGALGALLAWTRAGPAHVARALLNVVAIAAGLVVVLAVWRAINGAHLNGQFNTFSNYMFHSDGMPVSSFTAWLGGRLTSVANTLVPFWLFAVNGSNPSINVFGGTSPHVIRFFFQYWSTLPFGIGLLFFPFLVACAVRFTRHHPWTSAAIVILPFVLFVVYWGSFNSGLLRE